MIEVHSQSIDKNRVMSLQNNHIIRNSMSVYVSKIEMENGQ